jgi:hypothetical protein
VSLHSSKFIRVFYAPDRTPPARRTTVSAGGGVQHRTITGATTTNYLLEKSRVAYVWKTLEGGGGARGRSHVWTLY